MKCIPPVGWVKEKAKLSPEDAWRQLSFRPILYLCTWFSALVIILWGDFTSLPRELQDQAISPTFWVWGGLSLGAPLWATVAMRMIASPNGKTKYRGMWIRLGADASQFVAVLTYVILRFALGDYHIYTMGVLLAVLIYVFHLVMFGAEQLLGIEVLAAKLQENKDSADG